MDNNSSNARHEDEVDEHTTPLEAAVQEIQRLRALEGTLKDGTTKRKTYHEERRCNAEGVRWAAVELAQPGVATWLDEEGAPLDVSRRISYTILDLRQLSEFKCIAGHNIAVRWTTRAWIDKDGPIETPRLARVKVVPLEERQTWRPGGSTLAPPMWRITVSLPVQLMAEPDDLRRALHHALSACAHDGAKPYLRKPDIVAFSSTLGRCGAADVREAQAIAHAARHPDTAILAAWAGTSCDPHGQALLWPALDRLAPMRSRHTKTLDADAEGSAPPPKDAPKAAANRRSARGRDDVRVEELDA